MIHLLLLWEHSQLLHNKIIISHNEVENCPKKYFSRREDSALCFTEWINKVQSFYVHRNRSSSKLSFLTYLSMVSYIQRSMPISLLRTDLKRSAEHCTGVEMFFNCNHSSKNKPKDKVKRRFIFEMSDNQYPSYYIFHIVVLKLSAQIVNQKFWFRLCLFFWIFAKWRQFLSNEFKNYGPHEAFIKSHQEMTYWECDIVSCIPRNK